MKNKAVVFVLVGLGVILAVLIGIYFFKQNKSAVNTVGNTTQENTNNVPVNEPSGSAAPNKVPAVSQEKTGSGAGENNRAKTEQSQNKLATDDFSINLPVGWKQTAPVMGASAMAINANENISDPAAQKINFKSYFAISYDTLQNKSMSEYLQTVKSGLQQAIQDAVFTKEQDMTMGSRSAHAIEMELTQQGVNFKILMVVIAGQGKDIWVISFNTTKSSWDGYKEMFYSTANSFNLKK